MPLTFPISYPNADRGQSYADAAFQVTLAEQFARQTFDRLCVETQRDFAGLQLCLFDLYGVWLGVGTAWRYQPANLPNHADPGYSWHEGLPVESKDCAFAIDTVGLNADRVNDPSHVWGLMERHLPEFGFCSFTQPQPTDPGAWSVVNRRPYTGNWDRPHIQSRWLPYSRNRGSGLGPFTSTAQLPHWPLPHIAIEPKYDIEIVGLDPFTHPLWGGDTPTPEPPAEEDDMIISTVWNDGKAHQFVIGEDRALYHRTFDFVAGWSTWEHLGGVYTGSPSASVQPDGTLEVYGRGTDGAVYQTLFRYGVGGGWTRPALVGDWPGV